MSACLNASVVLMSGLGAPLRTATPMPEPARSVRLPATLPCLIRSSMPGAVRMATSNAAPFSISALRPAAVPNVNAILFSVAFSNCGASCSRTVFTAFELSTLTSAAPAADGTIIATAIAATVERALIVVLPRFFNAFRCWSMQHSSLWHGDVAENEGIAVALGALPRLHAVCRDHPLGVRRRKVGDQLLSGLGLARARSDGGGEHRDQLQVARQRPQQLGALHRHDLADLL